MGMGSYGEHTLYYRERERWREIEEKGPVLPYHYSLKRSSVGGRREGFSPVKWAGRGWTGNPGRRRDEREAGNCNRWIRLQREKVAVVKG